MDVSAVAGLAERPTLEGLRFRSDPSRSSPNTRIAQVFVVTLSVVLQKAHVLNHLEQHLGQVQTKTKDNVSITVTVAMPVDWVHLPSEILLYAWASWGMPTPHGYDRVQQTITVGTWEEAGRGYRKAPVLSVLCAHLCDVYKGVVFPFFFCWSCVCSFSARTWHIMHCFLTLRLAEEKQSSCTVPRASPRGGPYIASCPVWERRPILRSLSQVLKMTHDQAFEFQGWDLGRNFQGIVRVLTTEFSILSLILRPPRIVRRSSGFLGHHSLPDAGLLWWSINCFKLRSGDHFRTTLGKCWTESFEVSSRLVLRDGLGHELGFSLPSLPTERHVHGEHGNEVVVLKEYVAVTRSKSPLTTCSSSVVSAALGSHFDHPDVCFVKALSAESPVSKTVSLCCRSRATARTAPGVFEAIGNSWVYQPTTVRVSGLDHKVRGYDCEEPKLGWLVLDKSAHGSNRGQGARRRCAERFFHMRAATVTWFLLLLHVSVFLLGWGVFWRHLDAQSSWQYCTRFLFPSCCDVHVPRYQFDRYIFTEAFVYFSAPGRFAAEGMAMAYDSLECGLLQQSSLAALDPLRSASECSVFQGVFKGRSADTAGHWCPSCNKKGSEASTTILVAGGCKLFVPLGSNGTKSCVVVRFRRKEPNRHHPGGADKGANPRTGSARWSVLVGRPGGAAQWGKQGRPTQELVGNVPRTAGRRNFLTWTSTVTCPSYAAGTVPYVVLEVGHTPAMGLLGAGPHCCFFVAPSPSLVIQYCSRRSFSTSPSQSCDSRQQQLVAVASSLSCTMVYLRLSRQHSYWSQLRDDVRSSRIRCVLAKAQRLATSAERWPCSSAFLGFPSLSEDLHGCWFGDTTFYYRLLSLWSTWRLSWSWRDCESVRDRDLLCHSRGGCEESQLDDTRESSTADSPSSPRVRNAQGVQLPGPRKVSKGGDGSCCVPVRLVHWFPGSFLGVSPFWERVRRDKTSRRAALPEGKTRGGL